MNETGGARCTFRLFYTIFNIAGLSQSKFILSFTGSLNEEGHCSEYLVIAIPSMTSAD